MEPTALRRSLWLAWPPHSKTIGALGILQLLWATLRIPMALVVLWLSREWIIARFADPMYLTHRVIEILGTPVARVLFFAVFAILLLTLWRSAQRLAGPSAYAGMLAGVAGLLLLLFAATDTPRVYAAPILLLLAGNLMPERLYVRILPTPGLRRRLMELGAGIAEVFFFARYLAWVGQLWTGRRVNIPAGLMALPAIVLAAGATALVLRAPALVSVDQALRMPSTARIIARGDFNWIQLDSSGRHLFVSGHGTPRLLRYDLTDVSLPPVASSTETNGSQDFSYDPAAGEVYVYDDGHRKLLTFDADSLVLKRTMPIGELSPGDIWSAIDTGTGTVTLASEADERTGYPFMVLDRATGAVRDKRDIEAGNLLHVAKRSRVYLSFFRRQSLLVAYDLATLKVTAEVPAPPRADRMAFLEQANEVLLAVPPESRVMRYDADTLAPKGQIEAMFGVRVLAVDSERNLLLGGSLVTGEVMAIDLATGRIVLRAYLGPWIRSIAVDPGRGVAYVSSNGALYELAYGHL